MAVVDAVVVGAGPNGLTAAVTLAQAGVSVRLYEAAATVGGGARTEELTLPGFHHDPCSAVHPFAAGSPALRALPLDRYGFEWVHPDLPLAHPLADGTAAVLASSIDETVDAFGVDGKRYRRLVAPFLGRWDDLAADVLGPLTAWPHHPLLLARIGLRGVPSARLLARRFRHEPARALLAGLAAHSIAPLNTPSTGGVALMFAVAAHEHGWPFPRGGSQALSDALASHLRALGGEIVTGQRVCSLDELAPARAYVLDVSTEDLLTIAGARLSRRYAARLRRYRRGRSVFKIDYALEGPVPWTAEPCRRAGTVHVGASLAEIDGALNAVDGGEPSARPFLIAAQPSLFDPTRVPAGKQALWVYGHVPNGWRGDLTAAIEGQMERFAPGFGDLVLARRTAGPPELEARNPNNLGGQIDGGRFGGTQALFRPVLTRVPYATSDPAIYLCSSATPPGGGVHGMCGYHAARVALRRVFGKEAGAGEWTGSRHRATG